MNTQFQTDRNRVLNALNECGAGEDLGERLNKTSEQLADFCANLQKSVSRQSVYNELTNKPCGIKHRNALRMGLVSAIGALIQWDVSRCAKLEHCFLQKRIAQSLIVSTFTIPQSAELTPAHIGKVNKPTTQGIQTK